MTHRLVAGKTIAFSCRCTRTLLCSLLLAVVLVSGLACQGPMHGTCPMRALAPSRDLHGTVSGPDGQPAADATVTAYAAKPRYLTAAEVLTEVGCQTTGPDGVFRFRVSRDTSRVYFVATRSGTGLGWSRWMTSQAEAPIVVQMAPAAELAGQVLDFQRKPVSGAAVSIAVGRRFQNYADLGSGVPGLTTRTDAQGRFRFQDLPAGQSVHFVVRAPGFGSLDTVRTQDDGYPTGQANVELQMLQSCTVEAAVVAKETGKPLRGVPLALWSRGMMNQTLGTPVAGHPDRVRWTDVPAGGAMVTVAIPYEGSTEWAGIGKWIDTKPGKLTEVKVELLRGQIVEFRAREAKTALPIRDFVAGMYSPQQNCGMEGRPGRDGIARLRVVPGEYPYAGAEAPQYRQDRRKDPVKVQAGKPLRLDLTLEKAPCYRGLVTGPDGKPVSGATVAILRQFAETITDASGRFELYPALYETDRTPAVTVVARYERMNLAACMEVPAPDQAIQVRLQPAVAREIIVVDPEDKPLSGAEVTIALGHSDVRPEGGRFRAYTDQGGKCTLLALPAGCPLALYVQAAGYVAQAKLLPAVAGASDASSDRLQLQRVQQLAAGPLVKEIAIPATACEDSIWGGTGRDSRGHIWFAVSKSNRPGASADLFELLPETGQVIPRGNVVDELKRAGLLRPDEQQMKIHSKIYQVGDYLYYVSMDEKGEDEQKLIQPVFGSHLWRLRLSDNTWEHLLTIPEAMVGIAVGGGKVYTLGYWHHTLYQYDIATGASRSVKIGSCLGHVSRNLIADARGHVYAPRCTESAGNLHVALVEYDEKLQEVGSTPLPLYYNGTANWSYGITALQPLPDGSTAMLTHNGWLTIIRPQENGPAKLEQVGWFHPSGPQMSDTLFVDKTGRYLMGAAQNTSRLSDWVTYDLKTGQRTIAPFTDSDPAQPSWGRFMLYGSLTQDDQGRCYVVGQTQSKDGESMRPLLLQVAPKAPVVRD